MKEAARKMQLMASEVGMARTVERFDKDRRKDLLARYVVTRLRAGDSAAAAEQYARADEQYQAQLKGLSDVLEMAHTTLTLFDVEKCAWETCRSLLAPRDRSVKKRADRGCAADALVLTPVVNPYFTSSV
jgi:hypothetical protein